MATEQSVRPGDRFKSGKITLEVVERPYVNDQGLEYCTCRVLTSDGFVDVADSDFRSRYCTNQLLTRFKRVEADAA